MNTKNGTGGIARNISATLQSLQTENEQLRAGYDAARQEIASLRAQLEAVATPAQPVAWALQWPDDSRLNLSTVFDTQLEATDHLKSCSGGVVVVPLYAAPQPPTSAEPTQPAAWKMDKDTFQFLSDVMTAAGLVEHGKQCKALAKRLNSGVMAVRETFQARWAQVDERIDAAMAAQKDAA